MLTVGFTSILKHRPRCFHLQFTLQLRFKSSMLEDGTLCPHCGPHLSGNTDHNSHSLSTLQYRLSSYNIDEFTFHTFMNVFRCTAHYSDNGNLALHSLLNEFKDDLLLHTLRSCCTVIPYIHYAALDTDRSPAISYLPGNRHTFPNLCTRSIHATSYCSSTSQSIW